MNLKREMIAVKERLDKMEALVAEMTTTTVVEKPTTKNKTAKKTTTKKKTVKKADPKAVKTTSEQIAQVEM